MFRKAAVLFVIGLVSEIDGLLTNPIVTEVKIPQKLTEVKLPQKL
jgi:hypothetical protein